jgi:hypothetical protein
VFFVAPERFVVPWHALRFWTSVASGLTKPGLLWFSGRWFVWVKDDNNDTYAILGPSCRPQVAELLISQISMFLN